MNQAEIQHLVRGLRMRIGGFNRIKMSQQALTSNYRYRAGSVEDAVGNKKNTFFIIQILFWLLMVLERVTFIFSRKHTQTNSKLHDHLLKDLVSE
jgi:hypothetical protein